MTQPRVVIIGGGLAGMTVAKELVKKKMPVVILEAADYLGGKAAADTKDGPFVEHGYHLFPAWYTNTRRLLRELQIESNFIDIHQFYQIREGAFPHFTAFRELSSLSNWWKNVRSGILPWPEALLNFYFILDLCSQSFENRKFLDKVSVNGFLRSRRYATENLANYNHQTVLQASSIPSYDLSAKTLQKLAQCWIKERSPLVSILNGNLQDTFISPFEQFIRDRGVVVKYKRRVRGLEVTAGKVSGVRFDAGIPVEETSTDDIFVLATPPEVTFRFVDDQVYAAERTKPNATEKLLAELIHLESAPMAGLTLQLNRRITYRDENGQERLLPKEHVNLYGSQYKTSFIDISQHWKMSDDKTVLSIIASNFAPLKNLSEAEMTRRIIEEVWRYIPCIDQKDIGQAYLRPNVEAPLFLNTVGAWHFRPITKTRIENLYIAGDYCQSTADLTTMESAVFSGLSTARDILRDRELGSPEVPPIELQTPRRDLLLLGKYLFLAPALFLKYAQRWKLLPDGQRS
jgi:hypothetical protein